MRADGVHKFQIQQQQLWDDSAAMPDKVFRITQQPVTNISQIRNNL